MCLAQGHNKVTPVRLDSAAPQSQIKHSTTPLRSVSNTLDPDQGRHSVGPDLGPNCLQMLSTNNKSRCEEGNSKSNQNYDRQTSLIFYVTRLLVIHMK